MSQDNPFQAPSVDELAMPGRTVYPGIGRLTYFLLSFGIAIGMWVVIVGGALASAAATNSGAVGVATFALGAALGIGGSIWVMILRLQNAGYSGWWCIASFVPLANFYVAFLTIIAPEGYAHHGTLDTAGKVVGGLFIGLFLLSFLSAAFTP